ncbi:MAG: hypothetical protein DMF69_02815 [Acidobacteria bacterium]|nr:MAG: hypothetical protein DMF69_02815 [Acidobacteriota bacterium]
MVDQEVADILQEIRNRVRAAGEPSESIAAQGANGFSSEVVAEPGGPAVAESRNGYPSLSIMARAWDRLPPVITNRSGTSARLELWVKAKLKSALRWFTWEQVNFNAATHHTFLELISSITTHQQELVRLQNQLKTEIDNQFAANALAGKQQLDSQQKQIDSQRSELKAQRAELLREIKARGMQLDQQQASLNSQQVEFKKLQSQLNVRLTELDTQQTKIAAQLDELKAQQLVEKEDARLRVDQALESQQAAAQSQLALLVKEFRERDERLLDEQRVCFKQLSLELSESHVLQDRARREIESQLRKLEEKD